MNLLVIGSGGREHALAWVLAQSPQVKKIYVAPGNAGTAAIATNLPIPTTDLPALADAAQRLEIDVTVVGPEAPLAQGIVDLFRLRGLPIFGPTKSAAEIETSKAFAKELMLKYGIPCARSQTFSSLPQALDYVKTQQPPIVVKADGLAAGKGAIVCQTREEAATAVDNMLGKHIFGAAGDRVLVEECLTGLEVSLLAFTDGRTVVPLVPACDYKRVGDGDRGPNTGGMGSYSPPGIFGPELVRQAQETILEPAVQALAREGRPYSGVLYSGLMLTPDGIKVLEFNARFGDPETQAILPRLRTDLAEVLLAAVQGRLYDIKVEWTPDACVAVVLASEGYPGDYHTGFPISGLEAVDSDVQVFHAGTSRNQHGDVVTAGGRVLSVAATGAGIAQARKRAYDNVSRIHFQGCHYRRDIALREMGSTQV
ncbi:MAG: phosphoribosylamine--glycine ligase [Chloroflexi bacterium]|nr:phosphoribosylamine--glycine ligase [Chloroflexota bacterium]